jgi:prepilin-type N-terminal cleavage/methylation domain-containing protein
MALLCAYKVRGMRYKKGFTLIELLVAMVVTGIVMSAVATLAFAMSSANKTTDDTSQKQAQIRFATLRITDLIRHCKLICGTPGNDLVIWKADDNPDNNKIDVLELAYIDTGNNTDQIRILEFSTCPDWEKYWFGEYLYERNLQIYALQLDWLKDYFVSRCQETYIQLVPECSNVQFQLDNEERPPLSRFVNISFDITENGSVHQYQIDSALRSWAGNLLNDAGDSLVSDDD